MTLCYMDAITCPNPDAGLSNLFSTLLKKAPPKKNQNKTKQKNKQKKLLRYTVDLYCSFSDGTKLSTKLCVKHDAASLEW